MVTSTISNLRRISPQDKAHYFFGYYDVPAFSKNNKLHLAHRVQFWDRLPREDDVVEIGFIERGKSTFTPLAQTTAWNFQQGSMLQWLGDSNSIVFNVRDKSTFGSCVLDVSNGEKYFYDAPVANVDRQGRYALSINFSRMFDFRPGYGYAGIVDPWREKDHPEDDGIYLLDFRDGSVKLILSLQQIWEFSRQWLPETHQKILVNHITFNPSGTRFVALVRYFPVEGSDVRWKTLAITASADGGGMRAMKEGYTVASHYYWKNDEVLMIYAAGEKDIQLYEWNDRTGEERALDPAFFLSDGHCSYSPDGRFVLYDSYPDQERYQHLSIFDLQDSPPLRLGKLYSYDKSDLDIRCDLHPRWNRVGDIVSLDSNHEGSRQIYELSVS